MIGDSNDQTNSPDKLWLTETELSRLGKAFANDSSANTNFSKTRLSEMVQLGGFLFPFDTTMRPALGFTLEVAKRFGSGKGENVPKALLEAKYTFIDNKTNIKR